MRNVEYAFGNGNILCVEHNIYNDGFLFTYINTITFKRHKTFVPIKETMQMLGREEYIDKSDEVRVLLKDSKVHYIVDGIIRRVLPLGYDNSKSLRKFIDKAYKESIKAYEVATRLQKEV